MLRLTRGAQVGLQLPSRPQLGTSLKTPASPCDLTFLPLPGPTGERPLQD